MVLNGSSVQTISGSGTIEDLEVKNNVQLLTDHQVTSSLVVDANRRLDINGQTLFLAGRVTGTGVLTGSPTSALQLLGTGVTNRYLRFDSSVTGQSNALRSIDCSGSGSITTLESNVYIYDRFQIESGDFLLNRDVILRSQLSGTARVAPVGGQISYGANGRFVVERFIPGRRAWRLLTAPITPATMLRISDAWQDGAVPVSNPAVINSSTNPNPGFGVHITYGSPAVNGYDQGVNGNTSIRYLISTGWNGVPTATNDGSTTNSGIITDQPGYMLFVRGDRGTQLSQATGAATSATVLRPRGFLHTGSVNTPLGNGFTSNFGDVFRVVANPYASPIQFHALITHPVNQAAGFADAFYYWDPNITGNNGVGGFVGMLYNPASSAALGEPVYDRSVVGLGTSLVDASGVIPSGSAIVLPYSGLASSLRIEETHKASVTHASVFRPARQLQILLEAENTDGSISINDGVTVLPTATVSSTPLKGLPKLANFAESISLFDRNRLYCIAQTPSLNEGDTIWLHVRGLRNKLYRLTQIHYPFDVPNGTALFLHDRFLRQRTPLVSDTTRYRFAASSAQPSSIDSFRFFITLGGVNRIRQFEGNWSAGKTSLRWQIRDTIELTGYVLERALAGQSFVLIDTLASHEFTYEDTLTTGGTWLYRLRPISRLSSPGLADTVSIQVAQFEDQPRVHPNPINRQERFVLRWRNAPAGEYRVRLIYSHGASIFLQLHQHPGGLLEHPMRFLHLVAPGVGHIQLEHSSGSVWNIPVLIQ